MEQILRQGIAVLQGMWQRRWIGLVIAWIVGISAAIVVFEIPDKYEASARIFVDTQSVLKPLMAGIAVPGNVTQQVTMLSRTLISRTNVEKLVRMADLDLNVKSKEEQEKLIDRLMSSLQIRSAGRDNIYTLTYRDVQPETSKRVVQSLVSIFVESSLGGKRQDSDTAKKFIDDQIKQYEKKLEEAEARLKEFKLRNIDLGNAEGKDYYGRMSDLNASLAQSRLELREAETSRDAIKRQLEEEEPHLAVDASEAPLQVPQASAAVDPRIDAMKRNLDVLRQRFTEEHPDVIGAKRVIATLEEQRRQEVTAQVRTSPAAHAKGASANPVYQQLKVSLGEAESNVASLRTRVAEYESRSARMRALAKQVPQIEAEHVQLNRDYDILRKNYLGLVSRRESAEISGEMQASAGVADFRLIDPPRVSPKPVAPNRVLLFAAAVLVSLGAGMLASFVANQLRPVIFDARSLQQVSGMPVLGSVSLVLDESVRRRERRSLVGFATGLFALLTSYGAGFIALLLLSTRAA